MNSKFNIFSFIAFDVSIVSLTAHFVNYDLTAMLIIALITSIFYLFLYKLQLFFQNNPSLIFNILLYYLTPNKKNYIIISKKLDYKYIDRYQLTYNKDIVLKTKKMLSTYRDRYNWNLSAPDAKIECIQSGQEIADITKFFDYDYYTVKFNQTYKKGVIVNTGSRIVNLKDPNGECPTFLFVQIREKMKKIILTVIIPKELKPYNARFCIYNTTCELESPINGNEDNKFGESLSYDDNIQGFQKTISFPRMDWTYAIVWEFPKENKLYKRYN